MYFLLFFFFFSSRRRHTRLTCDWSSDVCSSDLLLDLADEGLNLFVQPRQVALLGQDDGGQVRSEERRVGKECRCRWSPEHKKKKRKSRHENLWRSGVVCRWWSVTR